MKVKRTKAYDEGRRAAAEGDPATANPYDAETEDKAHWTDGHASIASAIESSQSEGT
jgi:hypothetical protein